MGLEPTIAIKLPAWKAGALPVGRHPQKSKAPFQCLPASLHVAALNGNPPGVLYPLTSMSRAGAFIGSKSQEGDTLSACMLPQSAIRLAISNPSLFEVAWNLTRREPTV